MEKIGQPYLPWQLVMSNAKNETMGISP